MNKPDDRRVRGHCPRCRAERNAHVMAEHKHTWHDDEDGVWGEAIHRVLQCAGCEELYYQTETSDSYDMEREWIEEVGDYGYSAKPHFTYYPAPTKRAEPQWLVHVELRDDTLSDLLKEMYAGLNADLRVLASVGARTVLDRSSELLGVHPGLTFGEKLDELVRLGRIGTDERATLDALVDAGSAAAHRGWAPSPEDVGTMMDVVEAFLHRAFVLDAGMKKIQAAVPAKPPRPPKAPKTPPAAKPQGKDKP